MKYMIYCLAIAVLTLYILIEQQNQVTELQMKIPVLEKEVQALRERNNEFRFQIAEFESPARQLELLDLHHEKFIFPNESEIVEVSCLQE